MKPSDYWSQRLSDPHVNPNRPVGLKEIIELADGSVLDYGCGFGRLCSSFLDYHGVDIAEHRIRFAIEQWPLDSFTHIANHHDVRRMHADTVIADNVLLHVPDDEIQATIQSLCTAARKHVIVAEHMDPKWRGGPYGFHRNKGTYQKMFRVCFFDMDLECEVMNPKYGEPVTVARWTVQ